MALPSSGTITIDQIRTEFGGSTPVSISQYYRGGGLVPDVTVNNSVPISGTISFSNFWGASNVNYVPAAVNWANISSSTADGSGNNTGSNAAQTITGVIPSITISISTTNWLCATPGGSSGSKTSSASMSVLKNGTTVGSTDISNGATGAEGGTGVGSVTVSGLVSGDNISFIMEYTCSNIGGPDAFGSTSSTWTVKNVSDGDTILDTFTAYVSATYSIT